MMSEQTIESHINDVLVGEAQKLALDFVTYLREQEMQFERGTGYWEDKRYWMIKYKDEYVCFILVNGYGSVRHKDEPEGWIIWSDDSGKTHWFADSPLDEHTKEIAWANVDFCGHCGGSCDGGFYKIIFGEGFDSVCNTTFRFDNPNSKAVECAKN
ncbi:MAG: hypothetical protein PHD66_09070 [Eubacteriales bacterium]|nr:hypothetical protein [Eubacteriales bacterium]